MSIEGRQSDRHAALQAQQAETARRARVTHMSIADARLSRLIAKARALSAEMDDVCRSLDALAHMMEKEKEGHHGR